MPLPRRSTMLLSMSSTSKTMPEALPGSRSAHCVVITLNVPPPMVDSLYFSTPSSSYGPLNFRPRLSSYHFRSPATSFAGYTVKAICFIICPPVEGSGCGAHVRLLSEAGGCRGSEGAEAVGGAPSRWTGVGLELFGSRGAEVAAAARSVASARDVVQGLFQLFIPQRPKILGAVLRLRVSGKPVDARNERRCDARPADGEPAAGIVRVVLGDAVGDGGDVGTGAIRAARI